MIFKRIIDNLSDWPDVFKYLVLMIFTLLITYYSASPLRIIWYIFLLIMYYVSDNEALWLAVFLSTVDGFAGFFGVYSATLTVLPGLPAVELAQIYIILSVIKASKNKVRIFIFYSKYMQILFIYLVFLLLWGQLMGFTGELNVYLRVAKGFIPMLLFYSIPRLFVDQDNYDRFFQLIFVIILLAFAAQIFTLITGISPLEVAGNPEEEMDENGDFRVFFNANSTLLGLFGALYYLNRKSNKTLYRIFLSLIVFATFGMAMLSATRGWIISFGLIIFITFLFSGMFRSRKIMEFILIVTPLVFLALSDSTISRQLSFSRERLGKIEAITEGDLSAGGTLQRLDYRSQRVMGAWKENPILGWGLSDMGYKFGDGHVGNQSLLAMSGIIGFLLLNGFILFFASRILSVYYKSFHRIPDRNALLVIIVFLAGWFIIHSSSGQQFNFVGMPAKIIPQAVFFSFGAFQYRKILNEINGKKI